MYLACIYILSNSLRFSIAYGHVFISIFIYIYMYLYMYTTYIYIYNYIHTCFEHPTTQHQPPFPPQSSNARTSPNGSRESFQAPEGTALSRFMRSKTTVGRVGESVWVMMLNKPVNLPPSNLNTHTPPQK